MKRSRPCRHRRKLKSGRIIVINKKLKKIKLKPKRKKMKMKMRNPERPQNYGFMFRSTNWAGLAKESRRQKKQQDIKRGPGGNIEFVQGRLDPYEVLAFIDLDKGFVEMEGRGVRMSNRQKSLIKKFANEGEYSKAHQALPPQGKMFANLALNAESIADSQKQRQKESPKVVRPRRVSKRGSLPSINKSNTISLEELDKWVAEQKAGKIKT